MYPDVPKTAITTAFDTFVSLFMQFFLRNKSQTFQKFIDEVLRSLSFIFAYVDNLLNASSSWEEQLDHPGLIFTGLTKYGININPDKC